MGIVEISLNSYFELSLGGEGERGKYFMTIYEFDCLVQVIRTLLEDQPAKPEHSETYKTVGSFHSI